jgi:hypothetical protein
VTERDAIREALKEDAAMRREAVTEPPNIEALAATVRDHLWGDETVPLVEVEAALDAIASELETTEADRLSYMAQLADAEAGQRAAEAELERLKTTYGENFSAARELNRVRAERDYLAGEYEDAKRELFDVCTARDRAVEALREVADMHLVSSTVAGRDVARAALAEIEEK